MKVISTKKAPSAVGPYSQAIEVNNFIFTSGQLPTDPKTGEVKTDTREATVQCIENIKAVLEEAGSSLDKIVKVTIFIRNMDQFNDVNEVYGKYFNEHKPARSCFAVAGLPADANVEIEAIAIK